MLKLGLSITSPAIFRQGMNYEAESLAIFAAFSTAPSAVDKTNINNLVGAMLDDGSWEDDDLIYVLAAADFQAAGINWKNPGTYSLQPFNAPTFTAYRGYTGNGSNAYLETGWVPSTHAVKYTLNSASFWWRVLNNIASNMADIGKAGDAAARGLSRSTGDLFTIRVNNAEASSAIVSSISDSRGMMTAQRTSSTLVNMFKNGVSPLGPSVVNSSALPASSMWILGANAAHFSAHQIAFASFGASQSGREASRTTAVNAYLQSVGAI